MSAPADRLRCICARLIPEDKMPGISRAVAVRVGVAGLSVMVTAWLALSIAVQLEGPVRRRFGRRRRPRSHSVLFHPSRDAASLMTWRWPVSEGFQSAGLRVPEPRSPRTRQGRFDNFTIVAVITNTYDWAPDLPTQHYLRRAVLTAPVISGVVGGAGSTGRSERLLGEALTAAARGEVHTRSFWLWRPNDKQRMDVPNREVALDLARRLRG